MISEPSLRSQLDERINRLEVLGKHLASLSELQELIDRLQAERDQLQQRADQLQAECDQLRVERRTFLHAWADLAISEEELERRSKETGGCSLAELLERLQRS